MEDKKPIKRSKELVSLSRDHHEGLLLCWKIRTGIANGTGIDRIIKYVIHFYETELRSHFLLEEKYVFPLLTVDNRFRILAESQHKNMVVLIDKLRNNDEVLINVVEFGNLLEQHIRFEERELFPLIEQQTDPTLLAKASEEIDAHTHKTQVAWDDFFWTKSK